MIRYRFLVVPFLHHGLNEKPSPGLGCRKSVGLKLAAPFLRNGHLSSIEHFQIVFHT